MEHKLTMGDIARLAGVGKSTVSRYFNGGYVKAQTKDKIRAVVEKYDYEPNPLAQMLKSEYSKLIGIVTPTLNSSASSRMINSLNVFLRERGYTCIIINTDFDIKREEEAFSYFSKLNVDGIVVLASRIDYDYEALREEYKINFVFMGQEVPNAICVVYDDYRSGYDIGCHVYECGHKNIAFLGVNESDAAVGVVRKSGVYAALKERGIQNIDFIETTFSYKKTGKIMRQYLEDHRPSVIVCATDLIAMAAYKEIVQKGLRVPEDISLVGFDGSEYADLLTPALTTVRFDNEKAGEVAGQLMIDQIIGLQVDYRNLISYRVKIRGSVKKI